ncbi:TPA: peptide chain release factor N(5)-glutamine methyltransferase [Salmonella enterica subsp. salamae serovar 9,46:z4,z24:z39:z42]|nr:peptide chain release factor N(5)-glutamine methyltransferase [Salmonella enterica subsp. salamae serovar 9,46:z4,z24:z39:z42]
MDFQHWLREAVNQLRDSDSPRRDAEILLEYVTGKGRTYIMAFGETPLTDVQQQQLADLLQRRKQGEPIAYLTGLREFWSLPLFVSPATLIPRPDTECLVEQALARLPVKNCRILDLGTGTGAIALARRNAEHLAIRNVRILQSCWFSALSGQQFDMIVSNPPYIDAQDPHLSEGDVRFEPLSALVADENGMADLTHIIDHARQMLTPGGCLLLEHGWQQGEAVRAVFRRSGYTDVETCRDYGGNERVTCGRFTP